MFEEAVPTCSTKVHKYHTILQLLHLKHKSHTGDKCRDKNESWERTRSVFKPRERVRKSTQEFLFFLMCACGRGSTRPRSCHSWILVRGLLCHWSWPRGEEGSAVAPYFLWERWAEQWGSGWPADHSGSPAAAPRSWCSAWPDAGSHSCSASSQEDGWGWVYGARRRRCWRCAGATVPSYW